MLKSTNKIKVAGLLAAVLFGSWIFVSCGGKKTTGETESAPAMDTTNMSKPERMTPDSLPPLDSSATTRPEGRNT